MPCVMAKPREQQREGGLTSNGGVETPDPQRSEGGRGAPSRMRRDARPPDWSGICPYAAFALPDRVCNRLKKGKNRSLAAVSDMT